jgi:hypothetical protein
MAVRDIRSGSCHPVFGSRDNKFPECRSHFCNDENPAGFVIDRAFVHGRAGLVGEFTGNTDTGLERTLV